MATATQPAVTQEFALTYRNLMLHTLTEEMETTCKVFAAIPDSRRDYRPDPKARTAWDLAWHIACEDVVFVEQTSELKFQLPDPRYDGERPKTVPELVTWYKKAFTRSLEKIRAMTPAQLATPVDFLGMLKLPAVLYLGLVSNHSIHHRGQLSTYLRPMGSRVPSIYGGSADEAVQP